MTPAAASLQSDIDNEDQIGIKVISKPLTFQQLNERCDFQKFPRKSIRSSQILLLIMSLERGSPIFFPKKLKKFSLCCSHIEKEGIHIHRVLTCLRCRLPLRRCTSSSMPSRFCCHFNRHRRCRLPNRFVVTLAVIAKNVSFKCPFFRHFHCRRRPLHFRLYCHRRSSFSNRYSHRSRNTILYPLPPESSPGATKTSQCR